MEKIKENNSCITFLFQEDGATLDIKDESSGVRVIYVKLSAEDVCQLFSRMAFLPCEVQYGDLSNVGKKLIVDKLDFEMPNCNYKDRDKVAYTKAVDLCPQGWQVDNYFGSRDNWFYKDGKNFCRATIRKWE